MRINIMVLLVLFFVVGCTSNIVGEAVSVDDFQESVYGLKTINPNFMTQADLNYNLYDTLKEKTIEIEKVCRKENDLDACVARLSPGWKLGCETGATKFFYDLVEGYRKCSISPDEQCLCEININGLGRDVDANVWVYEENGGTVLELDGIKETIPGIRSQTTALRDFTPIYSDWVQNSYYQLQAKHEKGKFSLLKASLLSNNGVVDFSLNDLFYEDNLLLGGLPKLYIYKDTLPLFDLGLAYVPRSYLSEPEYTKLLKCRMPKERYVRVCAETQEKIMAKGAGFAEQNITYKFALFVEDKAPPEPVQGVLVKDNKVSQDSVVVEWDENPELDVSKYIVHYGGSEKELLIKDFKSKNRYDDIIYDARNRKYVFDSGNKGYLQVGETYILPGKFMHVLEIPDGSYDFSVTAVDRYGNVDANADHVTGQSVDDLAPGGIQNIRYSINGLEISLLWDAPVTDENGGVLDDDLVYKAYYSSTRPTSISQMQSIGWKTIIGTSGTIVLGGPGDYYVGVVAYDASQNPDTFTIDNKVFPDLIHIVT